MDTLFEEIGKIGVVPVVKIDDPKKAVPLAAALAAGGIPCAEITFRTDAGEESIRRIHQEMPDVLLGAGTVLTKSQVDKAVSAGARFIVSPGFNPKIVAYCAEKGVPIVPGCANPSDIEQALEAGLNVVKFFPAEQAGGLDYIKAISAPYSGLKFMPTGGISAANIAKYTAFDKILACGGSWMVSPELINNDAFDDISALCRQALFSMLGFSLAHIGINSGSEAEALKNAQLFETLFGFGLRATSKSFFAGDSIEVMNKKGPGTQGHIGIGTWSVPKAAAYLERRGIALDPASAQYDPNGNLQFIYLKDEILQFAVHLSKRK
ncbi:MAG: bifunctional 4-hydroxy-2-oxoglutarate aldolase/2-dehydro-3-deoxy-phosphogluconate aldolase [Spirochaetaceae bacterium]|jgi:2-dehydro-3-deoxyphosphogluconate aldolase/(4S)-4-hydroxy-2-oxoglutarate aldolase|nr:bifunctional 4-hydroxy-2-oxoglutarate aldolase/2-dehydro-3-deoxy-phosphogluconate aldolase [Spirochaetaceae bacterium]